MLALVDFCRRHALEQVVSQARGPFSPATVQADVMRIVEIYRHSGRYDVRVDPKTISRGEDRVDLVFEIKEGAKTAGKAVGEAGRKVGHAARDGAVAVKEGARKAGKAVAEGARKVGEEIKEGAKEVGHKVKEAVSKD